MLEENIEKTKLKSSMSIVEDPTRKVYKQALTTLFLITITTSLLIEIISQVHIT